jgi:hypothetical protein
VTPLATWLETDHAVMGRLLDRAARGPASPFDRDAFEGFRAQLLRHIAIEEKILFAATRRARGGALPRAERLRGEHAAITSLLVPTPDCALVGEIHRILGPHDELEEGPGGVYQECEELLGDGWRDVLARAQALPAIKVAAHFDGRGTVRTAAEALARANRQLGTERGVHGTR